LASRHLNLPPWIYPSVRQVGERVEDPPANSMASFQFTRSVPSQGTTFVFGSWVCVADGTGSFRRFLIDMKPKTPTTGSHSDLDKFVDDLDDLSIHGSATRTEEESANGATSSSASTTFLRLDSFQSEDSHSRSRLGLCNLATNLQEADIFESLSTLRRTWTLYSNSESPKPPFVGGLRVVFVPTV
jgi:hypothetical protein